MIGIYKITSPTGRVYIGQSWDIIGRWEYYIYPTCKNQKLLYRSLIKHGPKSHSFEVIHELPKDVTQQILDVYEVLYWRQHIECGHQMLNIKEPGSNGKHSEETKLKISQANKGKVISQATREKHSKRMMGYKMPLEIRKKLSAAKMGKPLPLRGPHSEETKQKIRAKRALQVFTEEHRRKMSEAMKLCRQQKKAA